MSDITRPTSLSLPPQKWYRSGRAPLVLAAAVCGVIAFVVSWLGSWVPSFWGDEAASIMSAERPWSSLMNELARVDAVHGTYYAFLHLWIDVFGASQLSTRVPSAIGVGLAAAGIVVLVARMERLWPANGRDGLSSAVGAAGIRLGVIAAMVFAVLPRTTYMGTEVRSYALGTACAVWLAVLFLTLVGGRVTRVLPWVGFAAAYGACIYVFLYLSLIALPFGAMLLWDARGRLRTTALAIVRPGSAPSAEVAARARSARRWLLASVGGVLLAAPLEFFALKERGQIKFLGAHPGVTFISFTVNQWFDGSWGLAVAVWAALVAFALVGVVVWRRRRHDGDRSMLPPARSTLLALAVSWFVLPPAALLAVNAMVPAYTVRYMSFTTPALAIILAIAIEFVAVRVWARASGMLRDRRNRGAVAPARDGSTREGAQAGRRTGRLGASIVAAIIVALVAAVAAPTYVAQRGPYAKNGGSDWAEVADVIQQHAHAGDDVVFDDTTRPSRRPRLAMHLYPAQFAGLVDPTLTVPYTQRDALWDKTESITAAAPRLKAGDGRVWLIEYRGPNKNGAVDSAGMFHRMAELRALGYSLTSTYTLHRDVVYLFLRGATA